MKSMLRAALLVSVLELMLLSQAHAQAGFNAGETAGAGKCQAGAFATMSQADYEFSESYYAYAQRINRSILGVYCAYGILDSVDLYVAGGYITQVELDQYWSPDESGYVVMGGLRHSFKADAKLGITVYAQYQYLSEDYGFIDQIVYPMAKAGGPDTPVASDSMIACPSYGDSSEAIYREGAVGVVANYAVSDKFSLYAGFEVLPYRSGTMRRTYTYGWYDDPVPLPEDPVILAADAVPCVVAPDEGYTVVTETIEEDARRSDLIGMRFGFTYAVENRRFFCEVSGKGGQTVTLGASVLF